jgi:Rap1a immunity proteins
MRSLTALMAFIFVGSAAAADSNNFQLRDAGDLARICSVPADDPAHANAVGFCHGILVGAFRYYESAVTSGNRFVCAPTPTPTRAKVMNDFVAWAGSHSGNMKDPPIDTLFRYLAETYPCKR